MADGAPKQNPFAIPRIIGGFSWGQFCYSTGVEEIEGYGGKRNSRDGGLNAYANRNRSG